MSENGTNPETTPADEFLETPFELVLHRFLSQKTAVVGVALVLFLIFVAFFAPVFVNGKPWLIISAENGISSPALKDFFAPDAQEVFVEKAFNWLMLVTIVFALLWWPLRRLPQKTRRMVRLGLLVVLLLPFLFSKTKMEQIDYRQQAQEHSSDTYVFAPLPYGPFETSSDIFLMPSLKHPFGTDQIGRDVVARMVYGARVSLAVGFLATSLSMMIGIAMGLFSGYRGGKIDIVSQRLVEIVICFPTFLLLLILMTIMLDHGMRQSILMVILVLGITDWPGLSRLVRGEVLKQRQMAYIQCCESLGVPLRSILFKHLLPNVSGPIFVSFAFSVAGAILAENSLSFLGFGVQDPSASWGELLKQAFASPLEHWNLMLWPGLAIFITMIAFNFIADGIRKAVDLKNG